MRNLILIVLALTGCASAEPVLTGAVSTTKIFKHSMKKKDSYVKMNGFLSEGLRDSNFAIKHKVDGKTLIVKLSDKCGSDNPNASTHHYSVRMDFKDNKTRFKITLDRIKNNISGENYSFDPDYSDRYQSCNNGMITTLENYIKYNAVADNW